MLRSPPPPVDERLRAWVGELAKRGVSSRDVESLGAAYEGSLGERDRRAASAHYTPASLAKRLVARTLEPVVRSLGHAPSSDRILALRVCDAAMGGGALLVETCCFLANAVESAWRREGTVDDHADATTDARRMVAARCLFGLDRDPTAVSLARATLWLLVRAEGDPFTFLDGSLLHGDALVGLDAAQIEAAHWSPRAVERHGSRALERATTRGSGGDAKLLADLVVGAFFAHDGKRDRERELASRMEAHRRARDTDDAVAGDVVAAWQRDVRDRVPVLHWPIAFARPMDAFVGNPPFVDGKRVSSVLGDRYSDWITTQHECRKTADLSGHFLRRCFALLAPSATLGMITTNSVSEGETRRVGLRHVVANGGTIYDATRSTPWPGDAVVHVALVYVARGEAADHTGAITLDGGPVARIRSSLTAGAERPDPSKLSENAGLSFHGYKPYGDGFQVTAAERDALVARDPRNALRLRRYAGGAELNGRSTMGTDRWVIHFGDASLEEARGWPDLVAILEARVRPSRETADDGSDDGRRLKAFWWQFFRERPELQRALSGFDRCLALARVSKHLVVQRPPADWVLDEDVIVFALAGYTAFAVLQSRVHERWARAHSSTFGEGLRYSSSRAFDTFPFPLVDPRAEIPSVAAVGREVHDLRAAYQHAAGASATTTYNRLLDPACDDTRIVELRDAHEELDRVVLDAYAMDVSVPRFASRTEADRDAVARFTEQVLDGLTALNAERNERAVSDSAHAARAYRRGTAGRRAHRDR